MDRDGMEAIAHENGGRTLAASDAAQAVHHAEDSHSATVAIAERADGHFGSTTARLALADDHPGADVAEVCGQRDCTAGALACVVTHPALPLRPTAGRTKHERRRFRDVILADRAARLACDPYLPGCAPAHSQCDPCRPVLRTASVSLADPGVSSADRKHALGWLIHVSVADRLFGGRQTILPKALSIQRLARVVHVTIADQTITRRINLL